MYEINEKISIPIERPESNFDRASDNAYRASDNAYRFACMRFGLNDDGHITNVKNSQRSTDSIVVEFEKYTRYGHNHLYVFSAWVERADDGDDDDDGPVEFEPEDDE